jgi:hypothetical protein
MTPEQRARVTIDTLLQAAGCHVCNVAEANRRANSGLTGRGLQRLLHAEQTESPPNSIATCPLFAKLKQGSTLTSSSQRRSGWRFYRKFFVEIKRDDPARKSD